MLEYINDARSQERKKSRTVARAGRYKLWGHLTRTATDGGGGGVVRSRQLVQKAGEFWVLMALHLPV
jgi:hypothetical protein